MSHFDGNHVKYAVGIKIDDYVNSYVSKMKFFVNLHSNKGKIYGVGVEEVWYI